MLADPLQVTYVQTGLFWENTGKNLSHFEHLLTSKGDGPDLVILPEMFTTGFSTNSAILAEGMDDTTIRWMKSMAMKMNAAIMGSIIIKEKGQFYNRLVFANPKGEVSFYDKRHLFRMGEEHNYFSAGNVQKVIEYRGWNIAPIVCYDLRFPVWCRNKNNQYDLLVVVANWPAARRKTWKTLLTARAIENQAYVVGVNRVGKDGLKIAYTGDSIVVNPKGELLNKPRYNREDISSVSLSYKALKDLREKFPVSKDADDFTINY